MSKLNEMYREFKKWQANAPKNYVLYWNWTLWAWTEPHHYYLSADIMPIIGEYRIDEHGTLLVYPQMPDRYTAKSKSQTFIAL